MSRRNFFSVSNTLYEFFLGPLHEYILVLIGVHDFFFHLIFPLREYSFCSLPPPPPHKFSIGPSLSIARKGFFGDTSRREWFRKVCWKKYLPNIFSNILFFFGLVTKDINHRG